MPQATSYNSASVINREQILDVLSIVAPEQTPLFSSLPKGKSAKSLYVEWGQEDLNDPQFDGVIDGSDVDSFENKADSRVRLGNRIQTFQRTFQVSRLQQDVETAGVVSEFDHARAKSYTELNIDIEGALGSDNEAVAGTGAVASKMRGFGKWIDSSNTNLPAIGRTASGAEGTTSTLTESAFNDVIQAVYEETGASADFRLFANSTLQRAVTDFSRAEGTTNETNYQIQEMANTKTMTLSVVKFISDWGAIDIIPDLYLGRTSGGALTTASKQRGYLINPDYAELLFLNEPVFEELPDNGGGRRGRVIADLTLCVKNSKAHGKFSG